VPIPVFNFQVNFLLREVKSKQHKKTCKLKNKKEIPQALKIFLLKKRTKKKKEKKKKRKVSN
jgi:hypothetical protein